MNQKNNTINKTIFLISSFFIIGIACSQDYWQGIQVPDSISSIYDIEMSPFGEVILCSNKGLYKSIDDGNSWEHFSDLNKNIIHILYHNDSIMYADAGDHLYKSVDFGQSWDSISFYSSYNIALKGLLDSLLFRACWGGIYKSSDGGISWDHVHVTYESQCFYDLVEFNGALYSSSIAFMQPEKCGLYRSDDNGDNWYIHSLVNYGITPLKVDMDNNLMAGVGAQWPAGEYPGLYITENPGISWDNIYSQGEVYSMAIDSFGGIYLGLESDVIPEWGVRYSNDGGQTWENINSGLTYSGYVEDLEVSNNNYIYAILHHYNCDSLYRSINPVVGLDDPIKQYVSRITFSPNPFYSIIQLTIFDNIISPVKIDVYDIFGRLIKHFEVEEMSKKHKINIDLRNYPPGIYIIELYNHTFHSTGKVIKSY